MVAYPEGYHGSEWLAIGSLFMPGKKPSKIIAQCAMTAQVPIAQAVEITDLATRLGISRHKVLLRIIGAGVSVIAAQVVPAVVRKQG